MPAKTIASLLLIVASHLASTPTPSCHAFSVDRRPLRRAPPSSTSTALCAGKADITDDVSASPAPFSPSRRSFVTAASGAFLAAAVAAPGEARAAADCFQDCLKNCKLIAPKDPQYCQGNCQEYCAQPDRTDGLSGSVSSEGGETGILGTTTVVKGEDRPPRVNLPGLDFTSDKGRKLIGY